jgi:hypothetical protein
LINASVQDTSLFPSQLGRAFTNTDYEIRLRPLGPARMRDAPKLTPAPMRLG